MSVKKKYKKVFSDVYYNNKQNFINRNMTKFIKFSETTRDKSLYSLILFIKINFSIRRNLQSTKINLDDSFLNWFAGLIDSDGGLYLSKAGYPSIEITMGLHEKDSLELVKTNFGGSINKRSNANALRWRLHKTNEILNILNLINGKLLTNPKQEQLKKLCNHYNLHYITPPTLIYNNSWLSGFFCGDGSLNLNRNNLQANITIGQKEERILQIIKSIYGGNVYLDKTSNCYIWQISKPELCLKLINYFENFRIHNLYKEKKLSLFKFYVN